MEISKIYSKYIEENYDYYLNYCYCFINNKNNAKDVLNDIILYVYENYKDKIDNIILNQNPSAFFKRIIYIQSTSSSKNSFHSKYENSYNEYDVDILDEEVEYDIDIDIKYNKLKKILNKFKKEGLYGEVRLFELYYINNYTYRFIEDLTGINYSVVFLTIKNIRENIINELKK